MSMVKTRSLKSLNVHPLILKSITFFVKLQTGPNITSESSKLFCWNKGVVFYSKLGLSANVQRNADVHYRLYWIKSGDNCVSLIFRCQLQTCEESIVDCATLYGVWRLSLQWNPFRLRFAAFVQLVKKKNKIAIVKVFCTLINFLGKTDLIEH